MKITAVAVQRCDKWIPNRLAIITRENIGKRSKIYIRLFADHEEAYDREPRYIQTDANRFDAIHTKYITHPIID